MLSQESSNSPPPPMLPPFAYSPLQPNSPGETCDGTRPLRRYIFCCHTSILHTPQHLPPSLPFPDKTRQLEGTLHPQLCTPNPFESRQTAAAPHLTLLLPSSGTPLPTNDTGPNKYGVPTNSATKKLPPRFPMPAETHRLTTRSLACGTGGGMLHGGEGPDFPACPRPLTCTTFTNNTPRSHPNNNNADRNLKMKETAGELRHSARRGGGGGNRAQTCPPVEAAIRPHTYTKQIQLREARGTPALPTDYTLTWPDCISHQTTHNPYVSRQYVPLHDTPHHPTQP